MRSHTVAGRALLGAALLAGTLGGCDDFVAPPDANPNVVPAATLDQLFVGAQVGTYNFTESELSRLVSMWVQQMEGVDRQFVNLYQYNLSEDDGEDAWQQVFRQGGVIDLEQALALAEEADLPVYEGILQVHLAYLLGMAAGVWGDIPFEQAGDPEIPNPELEPQLAVYEQVQALLDAAIQNLQTGRGEPPIPSVDFNFNGDAAPWLRVAHSLKARFFMHVAEVEGTSALQRALEEAALGISSPLGNWMGVHTQTTTEQNLWHQFMRDRSGYIAPNPFFTNLLAERDDPRLLLYFAPEPDNPEFFSLRDAGNAPGAADFDFPMVTCAETQFIRAEAALKLGNTSLAREAFRAGIACQEAFWGVDIPEITGVPTLEDIITEKYIALFLNPETWNDYNRTCLPDIVPVGTPAGTGIREVPPGLYYPGAERRTNANVPSAGEPPNLLRNANNPDRCPPPPVD